MIEHAVVIAGAGPTGLMLAGELALAGIDVAVVERRLTQHLDSARAGGLQSRTLELFDQRDIVDRFLAEGQKAQVTGFAKVILDLSKFPTRHPYGLGLWQKHIERIMARWVEELGVTVSYGVELTGFTQDAGGVDVALSGGRSLRARYLVGCDGGRSFVRKAAGIDFPGWDPTVSNLIAEVEATGNPPLGVQHSPRGTYGFGRLEYEIVDGKVVFKDEGPLRVMIPEREPGATGEPTLADLSAALIELCGTDYGVHSPTSISRFTDATRQAASYRMGRILLAGDAAHIHYPIGGQGLNTGVQDAMNLGWKLGLVLKGHAPETLLDSYHAERHPVGARLLRTTMAQVVLHREDARSVATREIFAELLTLDGPRALMAAELSGLGIHYDLGEGHPLLGRRMPDLDLETDTGPRRMYTLLHRAQAILLSLRQPGALSIEPWTDRVELVHATYDGQWELPAIGVVPAPDAVLVRPDGYIAWVGEGDSRGLADALTRWFGPPR